MIIVFKVLSQILGGGEEGYNGLIFTSQSTQNEGWDNRIFQTENLMYSDFNKITNYYVLYGNFDEYWKVPGKYSYSEFNEASGTDSVTVYVNTAPLSSYPEHITYKNIDEYKTDAEGSKETEIIQKLNTALSGSLGASNNFITSVTDIKSDKLGELKTAIESNQKDADKLLVIQQLVNECAKQLGYNDENITVTQTNKGNYTFGGIENNKFNGSNSTEYNLVYNTEYNNITITTGEPAQTLYTISTGSDNTSPKIIENTIAQIKTSQINDIVQQYVNTAQTLTDNIENAVTIIDRAADYNNIAVAWENAAKYETDDDKKKQYYGYAGQAYSDFCNEIKESHNKYDSTSGSHKLYSELLANSYIKSAECYTKSNQPNNASNVYIQAAQHYYSLGINYCIPGNNGTIYYIEAARAYEKVGDIYGRIGNYRNAYDNAVQNYVMARNYQKAGNVYEKLANEIQNDFFKANHYMLAGDVYKAAGSDYETQVNTAYKNAGTSYNNAVNDAKNDYSRANYYMLAGDAYKAAGSGYETQANTAYKNAGTSYNNAVNNATSNYSRTNCYMKAGDAYKAAGKKDEANTAYNNALMYYFLDGSHEQIQQVFTKLEELKSH